MYAEFYFSMRYCSAIAGVGFRDAVTGEENSDDYKIQLEEGDDSL
jgi:hypothetical protein